MKYEKWETMVKFITMEIESEAWYETEQLSILVAMVGDVCEQLGLDKKKFVIEFNIDYNDEM